MHVKQEAYHTENNLFDPHPNVRIKDGIWNSGSKLHCLYMDSPRKQDQASYNAIQATESDGTQTTSSVKCELKIKVSHKGACKAYKFKHLAGNSLISLPMLANQGCIIIHDKSRIVLTKDGTTLMSGYREK